MTSQSLSPGITSPVTDSTMVTPQKTSTPTTRPTELPSRDENQNDESMCTCSPIEDIPFEEINTIISNPFEMPDPGKDDGHHGVDFAFYRFGDLIGMDGLSINSLLPGTVAATILDRPPYGNTIIVETRLSDLPSEFVSSLNLPEASPTVEPIPALYCPEPLTAPTWDSNQRSIYLLYAHMKYTPDLNIGDAVSCCQPLGEVGTSGNSVNEHLHLEFRIGPSDARFEAMAHYDNASTIAEMSNYCLWRVSNTFQLIDPIKLIYLLQSN